VTDRRVRVVHVLEATVGGTKKHVLDLCTHLDPARFDCHAILSPLRDPCFDETRLVLQQAGVHSICVPMRRSLSWTEQRARINELRHVLRKLRPDIVHCHSSVAGLVGRIAARRETVAATVYTPHGFPFCMQVSLPLRLALWAVEAWLGRSTTRIVAVGEGERQVALQRHITTSDRCVVIQNGVNQPAPPRVDRSQKLLAVGVPPDARTVLCVGDLREQKGHVYAIKALGLLAHEEPPVHLLIAGEGELAGRLDSLARELGIPDRLHLLGARRDVPELLACCDVFCQPSLWEACPYAVVEAAVGACAIVGTDIAGIREIVRPPGSGWLVPPGDAEELSRALQAALAAPEERAKRGARVAHRTRDKHSIKRMIALTEALYEDVAQQTGAPRAL